MGEEDFLGAGPASRAVSWVAAVRWSQRLIWGSLFDFFFWPNVMAVIILAKNSQNYPGVAPMSQGGFWSHGA
jgi:hypothetical protein